MLLQILALTIFIFGAYVYGSVVVLTLRRQGFGWSGIGHEASAERDHPVNLVMSVVCTVWFVLHGTIEWRVMLGDTRGEGWLDVAVAAITFTFPGLIFHTVLLESGGAQSHRHRLFGRLALAGLYVAGAALAVYVPLIVWGVLPEPRLLGAVLGISAGVLFTLTSLFSLAVMGRRPSGPTTPDRRGLHRWMQGLFGGMIAVFFALTFLRDWQEVIELLSVLVRSLPLVFLIVSVYFENRLEFYDLLVKRGVLLLVSLGGLATVLALMLRWTDGVPASAARPVLFAVLLLPVAMVMPWLHARVGAWLDRWWFGRDFTPVEAVKHVLSGLQQATDERSLVAAANRTLSEMFRRHVSIVLEGDALPADSVVAAEARTSLDAQPIRVVTTCAAGMRPLLSEDHALLRSLASVFGFMLENVRLQRRRQEQDQVAHELRLQTSRSELKALRAQINPHFLFNALNAIASLIHTDPARADAAVEQLAEVFRYTLRRSEQEWAPLDQELAFARAYLDVEQARFGPRLAFSIDADASLARTQVPSMLLQTLVENAVKHGISRARGPGSIAIHAGRDGGRLTLEVRDTGPGLDDDASPPAPDGEGFGLRSVRQRLQAHFGADATLALVREGMTTVARLQLPLVKLPVAAGGAR